MTKLKFDKEKYYFNQNCSTCKHSSYYTSVVKTDWCYCHILGLPIEKDFVCDFYKLSRSKAKNNLHKKGET